MFKITCLVISAGGTGEDCPTYIRCAALILRNFTLKGLI